MGPEQVHVALVDERADLRRLVHRRQRNAQIAPDVVRRRVPGKRRQVRLGGFPMEALVGEAYAQVGQRPDVVRLQLQRSE